MTTPADEPRRADGTDQPVVGSGVDREAYWHERYVELKREYAAIDMQLAAHRYALELQNTVAGLPPDNEKYDKLPELLAEVRECLREAANDSISRGVRTAVPWTKCSCETCTRWRRAAGPDTGQPQWSASADPKGNMKTANKSKRGSGKSAPRCSAEREIKMGFFGVSCSVCGMAFEDETEAEDHINGPPCKPTRLCFGRPPRKKHENKSNAGLP